MADHKGKTKAAMLQELESIKGLLRDEDDIPILQEVIAGTEPIRQPSLARHDLDELHHQFQQLSRAITGNDRTGNPAGQDEKTISTDSLLKALSHAAQQQTPGTAKADTAGQQPSLFQEHPNDASDTIQKVAEEVDNIPLPGVETENTVAKNAESLSTPDSHPASANATSVNSDFQARPPLAKASGENPFLPQHIRARLHGNNPPPLFDFSVNKSSQGAAGKYTIEEKSGNKIERTVKQRLIEEVIASMLPDLENELRKRLEGLNERELEQINEQS